MGTKIFLMEYLEFYEGVKIRKVKRIP